MAFYIELLKIGPEDELFIYYIYKFSLSDGEYKTASGKKRLKVKEVSGRLKIDKKSGIVHIVEIAEGDNGSYVQRAIMALVKHWRQGELPDKTCWAS